MAQNCKVKYHKFKQKSQGLYENNELLLQKAIGLTKNDMLMAHTSQNLIENDELLLQISQGLCENSQFTVKAKKTSYWRTYRKVLAKSRLLA